MAHKNRSLARVGTSLLGAVVASTVVISGTSALATTKGGHYATSKGGVASCHQISVRGDLAYHVFIVNRDGNWRGGLQRAQRAGTSNRFDVSSFQGFILKKKRVTLIAVDTSPFGIPRASRSQWRKLGCPLDY